MKANKFVSFISVVLCAALMGSVLTACGSSGKSKRSRSKSKSERSYDDEDDEDKGLKIKDEDDKGSSNIISADDYMEAIEEVLDCDDDEFYISDSAYNADDLVQRVVYDGDDSDYFLCNYYEFEDNKAAEDFFEYQNEQIEDFEFDGQMKTKDNYILMDGEFEDDDEEYDIYGGIYLVGNTVIEVVCDSSKSKHRDKIDEILEELDLPTP